MLGTVSEAMAALTGAISGLLTPAADPALAPDVVVTASRTHLSGIGGFIGLHGDPHAERHARLLDAQVVVRIRAASPVDLLAAEAAATRELIGGDPAVLRSQGVLRLERLVDRDDRSLTQADGLGAPVGRELRFAVRFEHRPIPVVAEGVLGEVPQDVTTVMSPSGAQHRFSSEFLSDPMNDFTAVTGAGSGTAGAWSWDPATQEIRQSGTRGGGENGISGNKTGAYLLLRPTAAGGAVSDFVINAEMRSDGVGGIGLVFRFVNATNFGFLLLEQPPGIRIFGRRTANSGALFADGGQSSTTGFTQGQFLRLRLLAQGDRFELSINETPALAGREPGLTTPGMVGFFCRRNATARFRHLSLTSL